jgi:hypothetical protein
VNANQTDSIGQKKNTYIGIEINICHPVFDYDYESISPKLSRLKIDTGEPLRAPLQTGHWRRGYNSQCLRGGVTNRNEQLCR